MTTTVTPYREHVDLIRIDDRSIYLVGTAHVSQASVDLAAEIIREVRPDSVAVELCPSRYQSMKEPDRWRNMDVFSVIKSGKAYVLLAQLILASFQKKLGKQLNVRPGAEMMKSVEVAEEIGAELVLADRDIRTTFKRVWRSLGLRTLYRLLRTFAQGIVQGQKITEEEVERLKSTDALEGALREFSEVFPEVRETLITERDKYLAEKLRLAPGKTVVAVIGAGHTPGIKQYIGTPIDLAELEEIPAKGILSYALAWTIPALIAALLVLGFVNAGGSTGTDMAKTWAIATMASTALGALAARAHPLTIFSVALVAPFTVINPFLRTGWIGALVETLLRKPRVSDMETVTDDMLSVKAWYGNRVRKILLVLVLVNLFGLVGSVVGGATMLTNYLVPVVQPGAPG